MLCVGAMILRLRLNSSAFEAPPRNTHFQPEAGNEIEKGFELKLTPMGNAMPQSEYLIYLKYFVYYIKLYYWNNK